MREIQLNMYHALALGAVMYWLGAALTRKLPALRRFCVPAPLVGGLCFALFNTLLYASGLAVITFDETLETVFMILFFTTVGFTVSIPMLVKSGRSVMLLLALSACGRPAATRTTDTLEQPEQSEAEAPAASEPQEPEWTLDPARISDDYAADTLIRLPALALSGLGFTFDTPRDLTSQQMYLLFLA